METVEDRLAPTVDDIIASIQTVEDAESALARFQTEIDDITASIEHHHQRAVDGLMDRDVYEEWRRRADGALWHKRRGEMRLLRYIAHERHQQKEHEDAEIRKALLKRGKGPKTAEEIQIDLELKSAQARAARRNTGLREEQAVRDRHVLDLLESIASHNDPALLSASYDLLCRVLRINGIVLAGEDSMIADALQRVVRTWRTKEGIA